MLAAAGAVPGRLLSAVGVLQRMLPALHALWPQQGGISTAEWEVWKFVPVHPGPLSLEVGAWLA